MDDERLALVREHALESFADRILASIRPAIHLVKDASPPRSDGSRLGGRPLAPVGFEWPRWKGRPLGFLGQVRCEEATLFDPEELLPPRGLLLFFYEWDEQPWGFDPDDRGGAMVAWVDDEIGPLVEAEPPAAVAFTDKLSLPPKVDPIALSMRAGLSLDDDDEFILKLPDEGYRRYYELAERLSGPRPEGEPTHQLLGHPQRIQGNMQRECQFVSNGVWMGGGSPADPRAAELEPGASEWCLLAQFDSDDDLGWMWGDVGRVYFWIRVPDLRAGRFDRAWAILQCC